MKKELQASRVNSRFNAVYNTVIAGIEQGEWQEHDKLPSVRLMAERMRVHRLTVFKAYQQLKQDNMVYVKEKSGYYIKPLIEKSTDAADRAESLWDYQAEAVYANRSRLSEIHQ